MSLQSRLKDLMGQTVVIKPFVRMSTDGYGAFVWSSQATTVKARVAFARQVDFAIAGQSVTPTHVAWLATTTLYDPRSQFKYAGTTYRILKIDNVSDQLGGHHLKFLLKGG